MYPLYEDIELSDEQREIVRAYIEEVNFHLPEATSSDFKILRVAKYLGFLFLSEDLESYGVGLACTVPGREHEHTFIRMSRGQLLGDPSAPRLPVNDPVLASDILVTNTWRPEPPHLTRHGVDSYVHEGVEGAPGFELEIRMLESQLDDIARHYPTGLGRDINTFWDISVYWGVLMAGRYPRLLHFRSKGGLTADQDERLTRFEERARSMRGILEELSLPIPDEIAKNQQAAVGGR